uniref:Retrovirus-related Pol polyprotein from transposon TNT 1-94-like beta-barrel domain-containing protein n=1 Tax=Cajanus cajan TaxID=3821 RepID=A0A151RV56_CAJCA|nr:hypothetical protein KK1_032000 [Cajanus cajan]
MLPLSSGFNVSKTLPSHWVLDSKATNYMPPSSTLLSAYSPCSSNKKLAIADGTLVILAGLGNTQINPFITLKNVFHVPT